MSTQLLNGQARSEPGAARAIDRQPTGGMDDSEVAAAFAAGDPAGLAAAYDRYAAPLYGYCRRMLPRSGQAANALLDTFAVAEATLGELRDVGQMRAWLYATARDACLSRKPSPDASFDEIAGEVGQLADDKRAELRRLIRATLAEFDQLAHEAIELTIRHNLDEAELATVLEIRWNRAHTVTSRAREHLGKPSLRCSSRAPAVTVAIGAVAFAAALYRSRAPLRLVGMAAASRPPGPGRSNESAPEAA